MVAWTSASSAWAQTDLTSTYLKNPSFENDKVSTLAADATRGAYAITTINGWTLSGTYGVSDIMTAEATATDNNLGKPGTPSDGSQMYYIRNAWANGSASLKQSITLPAGKYRFSVDNKCATPGTSSSGKMVAGTENTTLTLVNTMPSNWATTSVDFTLDNKTTIDVGFEFTWVNSAGASFLFDNCRLYDITDVEETPDPTETDVTSYTEGVIDNIFVPEGQMKSDLLQMLADFSRYMVDDFQECQAPNSKNELCGCFKGENTMGNNEQGVRPNADLSMICAFLVKYGKPAGVKLPSGITWDKIEDMARKSLVFAYSTHKANKLKVCSGNNYWGSTSTSDAVWESSLWAMSVAYSAYFQWDKLSDAQKNYIYQMLKAECNYELGRSIPTGYAGDTKAEENGWEADILAATLGLFPNDELAPRWFERLREFAVNSYSHMSDATNTTIIDPEYNNKTIADLYRGQNLYDDYSLQNHNLFHTSYQNVVMQELGEAALALKMFQRGLYGEEKWKTNALMHHNQEVQDSILNWLALADGELAMPNGNDWSLFLYDQITSYTTQACFQRDANALMLENMAYKYIKARQRTTSDGSWLLRADVGARRMGVEAHRVMMTYLMHDVLSTETLTPKTWDAFNSEFSQARIIPCQNIVRAATDSRFTCFSWSDGLKSYTGYFAANSADKNKIVVPYRANNTGNLTGWYEVSGKSTDATPVVKGIYRLKGNAYVMNGEMNVNGSSLNNRFAIYSTPQNAIIYLDYVTANSAATITAEKGGLLAISTDELMKTQRTLYYSEKTDSKATIRHKQTDGSTFMTLNSEWVNIDNELGIVSTGNGKKVGFGDRGANNSIYTSKLYPVYANDSRSVKAGDIVDARNLVYYSNIDASKTQTMAAKVASLRTLLPQGWNGAIAADSDASYILISNFKGTSTSATIEGLQYNGWAPVLEATTTIADSKAAATLRVYQNNSYAQSLTVMVKGNDVTAQQTAEREATITATKATTIEVGITTPTTGAIATKSLTLAEGESIRVWLQNGNVESESIKLQQTTKADYTDYIINPAFEGNSANGWTGGPTVNYGCAEKYNTNFDINQTITGLPRGIYRISCQGFYRDGTSDNAASHRTSGNEKLNAQLYTTTAKGTTSVAMMSILEEANKLPSVGIKQATYGYIPNTMEQADIYFRHGLYNNSIECEVGADGKLTIGIKKSTANSSDWCIFDNFTLTLVAPYREYTLATPEASNYWSTFVAPFQVALPDGIKAYNIRCNMDEVLKLDETATNILPAYTPVLLKGTNDYTATLGGFDYERQPTATDTNGFLTGVLSDTQAPASTYVLQNKEGNVAFYRVKEGEEPTLKGGHAYLTMIGSDAKALSLELSDGISTTAAAKDNGSEELYDLQGRRSTRQNKGILVKKGQKILITE